MVGDAAFADIFLWLVAGIDLPVVVFQLRIDVARVQKRDQPIDFIACGAAQLAQGSQRIHAGLGLPRQILDARPRHKGTRKGSEARSWFKQQRLQAAEAALAPMEGRKRFGEILGLEFGPHPLGEVQFGISAFPEQEIG
jgi:hypothetical protein